MTFHYIRKNDATGTIQRVNGMGVGLALRKLEVDRSRLPLASQVEIIRFAADILNDAMKNKFVHGDIKIDNFAVMNDGSLIINGYDRPRRNSITPEGTMSLAGDIYGLGLVMLELFSGQRNIELPLEQHLHNQRVLEIFLTIDWQEWAQQPWLTTMQEYLISLLFFEPSQRPHPLDIANILKEASQITTSLGIRGHMKRHGLKVSMEKESLEMAQALRSSALISPVEVMADSEGTATGFFTRDKIAEMFNQPIAEDTVRRTEWMPESTTPVKTVDARPLSTPSVDDYDDNVSLDLPPPPTPNPIVRETSPPVQQSTWTPPAPTPPPVAPAWTPPEKTIQPPPQPTWTSPPPAAMPRVEEQPTATHPSPQPWQPSVQPVQEQPTPSIPPASSPPPNRTPTPPPIPTAPQFSIGAGQQPPPPNWANPQPHNRMVGASHHQMQKQETGGIDKNILIGAGIGALLILMMGIGAWALLSGEDSIEEDTIRVERVDQQFNDDDFEEIEPSEEEIEEEVEEPIEEIKPKQRSTPPKKTSKPKRKRKYSKKKPSQKTEQPKTQTPPEQDSVIPTTVGVGEFSVTIRFNKPATLKCGDGQSKDFVNQTKMTFKTRTACRINTEDDEQGALSANKSGTIRCSLSGTRIRCK